MCILLSNVLDMDTSMERLAWILSLYGQDLMNMFSGI